MIFFITFIKICYAFSPSDNPLFKKQYYIKNNGLIFNGLPNEDLNVVPAWEAGSTGENVHIVIINDGCQANHSELKENFDFNLSYNYITNTNDPSYDPRQFLIGTGTKLATIAAGANNQICGIGIAFKSKVSCVSVFAGNGTAINYQEGIKRDKDVPRSIRLFPSYSQYQSGLIYISQFNEHEEEFFNQEAIYITNVQGGSVQVNEDLSYLNYPSNPNILTFAEISQRGGRISTSLRGNVILGSVVTGGGDYDSEIALLSAYISTGDGFGSTCSETLLPTSMGGSMAAGVISLILSSTNETLKTNDITAIIALTSVKNDPYSKTWKTNKNGIRYSPIYGFGRLDAEAAVRMAKTYHHREKALPETAKIDSNSLPLKIPTFLGGFVDASFELPRSLINYVDFIELFLTFSPSVSEYSLLRVFVISPSGTERLVKDVALVIEPASHSFRIAARDFFGEKAAGKWTVRFLRENVGSNDYLLLNASIKITGYEETDFPAQSEKEGSNPFQTYERVDAKLTVQSNQKDDEKAHKKSIGFENEPIKIQCNKLFYYLVETNKSEKYSNVPFDLVLTRPNDDGQFERFGVGPPNNTAPGAVYCMYKSGTYKLRAINPALMTATNDVEVELLNPGGYGYDEIGFSQIEQYRRIPLTYASLRATVIPINIVKNRRETFSNFKAGYIALATLWDTERGVILGTQITQTIGGQFVYGGSAPCRKCVLTVVPLETDELDTQDAEAACNTFVNALSIVEEGDNSTGAFEVPWNFVCPVPKGIKVASPSISPSATASASPPTLPPATATASASPWPSPSKTHEPAYYRMSTTMIVIIAVSSCAGLCLLLLFFYCMLKRKKQVSYGTISTSLLDSKDKF